MLNKRAALGLQVITIIASAPSDKTITANSLASATGVSLSYIEGILKDARGFRLIQSTEEQGTLRQETVHQSERRQEDPIILQLDDDDTVVEDLEDDQLMQDKELLK